MRRRVILLVFDGAQSLDVFGPAEVFAGACRLFEAEVYELVYLSTHGRPCETSASTAITTRSLSRFQLRSTDTVLVAGGEEGPIRKVCADEKVRSFLWRAERVVARLGSVCSGAFVLASAGLLRHKRCATHWSSCERLSAFVPEAQVDKEAIFVVDGKLWTSAGVTTGIDMALAMLEQDHGKNVADAVAARLVLYGRRPGFQSQFSETLVAQKDGSDPLGPAIAWARRHLREVDVEALARRAGMSLRTLHRRSVETLDLTPAKLIEKLRVEQARTLLASTRLPQKTIAHRTGFGDTARLQRALKRSLGMDGKAVRLLSASGAPDARALLPAPVRSARS